MGGHIAAAAALMPAALDVAWTYSAAAGTDAAANALTGNGIATAISAATATCSGT